MGRKYTGVIEKVKAYRPLGRRVVIKRLDPGDMSEGGLLHIPEEAQEERRLAVVLAVGPGKWQYGHFVETTLKPGDVVLTVFGRGVDVMCGDEKLKFVDEDDCMAVVVPDE